MKNVKTTSAKANTKNTNTNTTKNTTDMKNTKANATQEVAAQEVEVNVDGLEAVEETAQETPSTNANFSNAEWLAANNPADFFSPEVSTNKLNPEREPSIAAGLKEIAKLGKENESLNVNPLVILLGLWWEVKPARAEIKRMIDKDAKTMGVSSDVYIQKTLRSEVEKFTAIRDAADRLSYAINFYKPRRPLNEKVEMVKIKIDGVVYEVAKPELIAAKTTYSDRDQLKEYILTIAEVYEQKEVEEF